MSVTPAVRTIAAAASAACLSLLVLSATPVAGPASGDTAPVAVVADGTAPVAVVADGTATPPPPVPAATPNDAHWG